MSVLRELKRITLCRVGLHVGYPEAHGDTMYFYCTRCERLTSPVDLPSQRWEQ